MKEIGKSMSIIYRMSQAILKKELAKYDLGSGQFMFLMHLYIMDGMNQEELGKKIAMDKGTTAKAVKKLEESGFIRRIRDEADKRAHKIFLTDHAKEIRPEIFRVLGQINDAMALDFTQGEKELLSSLSEKAAANLLGYYMQLSGHSDKAVEACLHDVEGED